MVAAQKTVWRCQECGHGSPKWLGQCSACGAWNSLVEEGPRPPGASPRRLVPVPLSEAGTGHGGEVRVPTGLAELDRVLGGGLVAASLTLLGGDPGVGKSTLLLMALDSLGRRGLDTLYVSAEESARQVRLRAERLGIRGRGLHLLAHTDLDAVLDAARRLRPGALVLDSVQTLSASDLQGVPGSVSQVREVAQRAMQLAKGHDVATILAGHVTKDGALAGPRSLEHLVDTVMWFEGDGRSSLRVLRATKNRFGPTGEIGLFEMRDDGLAEVPDASARLLDERMPGAAGTAVVPAIEGTRPMLVEVQALVGPPGPGTPARSALGVDRARVLMLLAVLERAGLPTHDRDIFVSAAGGLRVLEPAIDLGLAAALASSLADRPLDPRTLLFGELGLVGEVRGVSHPQPRLKEAVRNGFRRVLLPASCRAAPPAGIDLLPIRSVRELLDALHAG